MRWTGRMRPRVACIPKSSPSQRRYGLGKISKGPPRPTIPRLHERCCTVRAPTGSPPAPSMHLSTVESLETLVDCSGTQGGSRAKTCGGACGDTARESSREMPSGIPREDILRPALSELLKDAARTKPRSRCGLLLEFFNCSFRITLAPLGILWPSRNEL